MICQNEFLKGYNLAVFGFLKAGGQRFPKKLNVD